MAAKPVPVKDFSEFRDLFLSLEQEDQNRMQNSGVEAAYAVDHEDLYFLYSLIRRSSIVSVMELGSGWSTMAIAIGIAENKTSFGNEYGIRHPNPFKIMSVDASSRWQERATARIPAEFSSSIIPVVAEARLIEYKGAYASHFVPLPAFSPDLIYLDGPDPDQVSGEIDGFHFMETHGFPMSADILLIEPHLWPQTLVVSDGRTANVRFVMSHAKRSWQCLHDPFGDRSILRLDETHYGPIGESHHAMRIEAARQLRAAG